MLALYIVWNECYETGIPILDDQLRGLVSLINTFFFHKADADKDINRILVPTATMLKSYAHFYFLTLEKLMVEAAYPDIESETVRHKEIMRTVEETDLKYRVARDADGFLGFLKQYWNEHACRVERPDIAFIKQYFSL